MHHSLTVAYSVICTIRFRYSGTVVLGNPSIISNTLSLAGILSVGSAIVDTAACGEAVPVAAAGVEACASALAKPALSDELPPLENPFEPETLTPLEVDSPNT